MYHQKKKKKVAFGIPLKKKTACMAAIEKDDKGDFDFCYTYRVLIEDHDPLTWVAKAPLLAAERIKSFLFVRMMP